MSAATSPLSTADSPRSAWQVAADFFDPAPHPYAGDPVTYAHQELGFQAWSKQADIFKAVRDHPRVAVRSSHGPGKTATAAHVALWFLECHTNSRVITTAPTWAQVEQLLWREIRAGVAQAHQAGRGQRFPRPSAAKLELGEQWFAIGLSTNEPERFQGHHADHLLLIVDEASGVDEKIFEAAEGFLTAEGAHILLLGNPTRTGGQFHRAFTTERADWHTIHISTFDTPNYTGETVPAAVARSLPRKGWAEEKAKAWGVDSPMYQVRVLGNFSKGTDNTVVALGDVEDAQARKLPPPAGVPGEDDRPLVTCDVARFGTDETVIASRVGQQVRIRRIRQGQSTVATVGDLNTVAREVLDETGAMPIFIIDDDGVGGGVTDQLRAQDHDVFPFRAGARPYRPSRYPNRRSELWFAMREAATELDLDPDEQLAADLTSPLYSQDAQGRLVVEKKDKTKKRLGRSPDRADAVLLTLVRPPVITAPPAPRSRQTIDGRRVGDDRHEGFEASAPLGDSLTGDLLDDHM